MRPHTQKVRVYICEVRSHVCTMRSHDRTTYEAVSEASTDNPKPCPHFRTPHLPTLSHLGGDRDEAALPDDVPRRRAARKVLNLAARPHKDGDLLPQSSHELRDGLATGAHLRCGARSVGGVECTPEGCGREECVCGVLNALLRCGAWRVWGVECAGRTRCVGRGVCGMLSARVCWRASSYDTHSRHDPGGILPQGGTHLRRFGVCVGGAGASRGVGGVGS
eukprot:364406-Chlamydomonas_euryale.AAC.7